MPDLKADFHSTQPPAGARLHYPQGGKAWAAGMLRALGWKLEFAGLPMQRLERRSTEAGERWVSRGVIIAYPHTSNWDGFIGLLAIWALGIKLTLWGKASLFKIPVLRGLLRSAGAVPIERTDAKGAVASTIAEMEKADVYWLGLAPEGTRKRLPGWRTGFYHVATQAQVPVGIAFLDWGTKRIGVTHFLWLSGDRQADFSRIAQAYAGVTGCVADNASPIVALEASFDRKQAVVSPGSTS